MKKFSELNDEQKGKAIHYSESIILDKLIVGNLILEPKLQSLVEEKLDECEQNKVPWFAADFILEEKILSEKIREMAIEYAKESRYPEPHESRNYIFVF